MKNRARILLIFISFNWCYFIFNIITIITTSPPSTETSLSSSINSSSSSFSSSSLNSFLWENERFMESNREASKKFREILKNNTLYNNINNNKRESIFRFINPTNQKAFLKNWRSQFGDGNSKEGMNRENWEAGHNEASKIPSLSQYSPYLVPNIVHFIWYAQEDISLKFHHLLSILSAHKFMQPSTIFFHTNHPPVGPHWHAVLQLDNFVVNHREPPTHLFGHPLKPPIYYTSHSNVDRVKILLEMGGIYLDLDVIVTRSFHPLRKYPCVIGREQDTKACGSVIVCSRDSPFLLLWLNSYLDDYQEDNWAYNSGQVPFNLANRYPHLVHMDENKLNRPNFEELWLIWGGGRWKWMDNFAVHTWYRLWRDQSAYYTGVEPDENNIKNMNNSFGEMARAVLYGVSMVMDCD